MNATTVIHSILSQQDYDVGPRMMWASYGMALDGHDGHLLVALIIAVIFLVGCFLLSRSGQGREPARI